MSIQSIDMAETTTLKEMEVLEIVRKQVTKSGNGGAVWVPRKWLGKEVVVLLPKDQPEHVSASN